MLLSHHSQLRQTTRVGHCSMRVEYHVNAGITEAFQKPVSRATNERTVSYTFFWYADEIFWVGCGLRIFRWVSVNLLEWFLQFSSTYWRCTRWISSIVGRRTVRHVNSCTVQLRISKAESCSLWTFTFWFIDCWRKYQNNDRLFQLWNTQISHLPLLLLHWLPPLFKTPQSYFSVSLSFADWLSPRYKFTWRPFHPVQVVPRRWFQSTTFPSPEPCLHLTQGWTP